ncbi:MAG: TniQ family protein [Arenimonas sp.]
MIVNNIMPTVSIKPMYEMGLQTSTLLRTPAPFARESLLPYALRLSQANGYPTPGYFMTREGAAQFVPTRGLSTDLIAKAARLNREQIQQLRYSDSEEDPTFGKLLGKRVSIYDLNVRYPRLCPLCIDQNGHLESLWELAWVTCCPVHECELVTKCPECHISVTWSRATLDHCQKGHKLNQGRTTAASKNSIRLARLIALKLYGQNDPFVGDWKTVRESDAADLTLYEIGRIAAGITNRLSHQNESTSYLRSRSALSRLDSTMTALDDLFFGSEEQQRALFDRLSNDDSKGVKHSSFRETFTWFSVLFNAERAKKITIVSKWLAYAKKNWPASRIKRKSSPLKILVDECEWVSAAAAAYELGICVTSLTKKIGKGQVPHKRISEKSNHCWLIPVEWVKAQASVPIEPISTPRLRAICGVSRAVMSKLRRDGLFKISARAGRTIIKYDVDQFVERLLRTTHQRRTEKSPTEMDFHQLMKGKGSNAGKIALVTAVLNGMLIPTGKIHKKGVKGLLFDEQSARTVLYNVKNDCTLMQANVILDCHNPIGLLQMGKLTLTRASGDRRYVSMESVIAFRDQFESPARLLKDYSIKIRTLLKVARLAKIELLPIPNTNRPGHLWFIPRSRMGDLEKAIPFYKDLMPPRKYRNKDLAKLNDAHRQYLAATMALN